MKIKNEKQFKTQQDCNLDFVNTVAKCLLYIIFMFINAMASNM